MSQVAVERLLGKLVTDESFRARFFRDPAGSSFSAGIELSRCELEALSRLPVEAIAAFSARLDARLRRLPLEEGVPPPDPGTPRVRRRRTTHGTEQACAPAPAATKEYYR